MTHLARLRSAWRNLSRRARVERDLADELQATYDLAVDEGVRQGRSIEDARRTAARELGPLPSIRQQVRQARAGAVVEAIAQDVRHGLRRLAREPLFTLFAVASLAVGIGADTALFSIWNGVLHAPLPAVERPDGLVMLTNPDARGQWTGTWNGREGPRSWLTYAEFLDLRDHAKSFSALMASQCSLPPFRVRLDGGEWEEARGRLVSETFFEVLGARAAVGRLFPTVTDGDDPPYAVISHHYWQRRFGGRPDVVGRTFVVHATTVTIIGVTAPGFVGETAGQQPDLWLPLRAQALVLPGTDRLHDAPPDKVMWLHAFGRLRTGVTLAQAEAETNAIFRANLAAFYGALESPDRRRESMDQRLQLHPASRGASGRRADFAPSLTALLAAVAVLWVIACANLATLLQARGDARRSEMALRLSLGATRARLLGQLAAESLTLAAAGGALAPLVAFGLHGLLVRMLARSAPDFRIAFALDPVALATLAGATVASALLFGLLPAWQLTRGDAATGLREESRGAVGRRGQQRSGRRLAGLQLALSLPLVAGAGLLARTVHNLQHADLGLLTDGLVVVRVDFRSAAYDSPAREAALLRLLGEVRAIPGVREASFSQLGLFTGGESANAIEVEGAPVQGNEERVSAVDYVGPGYFATLHVPILRGRDVGESDVLGADPVCVVNEGFVARFVAGRDPMGLAVTAPEEDRPSKTCRIVGVTRDARTQGLRDPVEPRYFVAGLQAPGSMKSPTILVRASGPTAPVIASVRRAIERMDASLPIVDADPIEEQIAPYTAQDRTTAQLAAAFGAVALLLAAIGLYGVLSYGIARRTGEIAVRMAIGARPGAVVSMILRETAGLVAAGLAMGLALTVAAAHLLAEHLYGVAPEDPVTYAGAIALLLVVALNAAYWPAQRASRLDPVRVLRQE